MDEKLKCTPLHDEHVRLGAKIIPFAGFEMPVHYVDGIVAEHGAVRGYAGLFDVSHMGELIVRGDDPVGFLQHVATNDVSKLEVGQAQYTVLCQEDGGALDDCLVYRFPDHYMVVVNASNRDQDRDWIRGFAGNYGVDVQDRSDEIALLALQGPQAQAVLARHTDLPLDDIEYYHFREGDVAGARAIVSRTGYTGEDGFELYVAGEDAAALWRTLLDADAQLKPAGLGARDALRLEVGYILYGNDLDVNHTPLEAGLGWVVKFDKEFVGREALARQKKEGVREKLVGLQLEERGFPRHGYVVRQDGEPVGEVTSGLLSPTLDRGIALAYVAAEAAGKGTRLEVMIRDRAVPATVVRPPFYTEGSVRR